jgi:FkbM family methyltransferase
MLTSHLSRALSPLFQHTTYTIRHGLARGLRRRGGLGFLVSSRSSLTKEEAFLTGLDLHGRVVYDVGGLEGLYTLFFARAVGPDGHVVCFEPNQESLGRIRTNVGLNGFAHVSLRPVALGAASGRDTMVIPKGLPGRGTGSREMKQAYQDAAGYQTIEVDFDTLDVQARALPAPHFIKIDVEGMELDVLTGAQQTIATHAPAMFIEIHGVDSSDRTESARNVLAFLERCGYSSRHVESDRLVTAGAPPKGSTHLYCLPQGREQ